MMDFPLGKYQIAKAQRAPCGRSWQATPAPGEKVRNHVRKCGLKWFNQGKSVCSWDLYGFMVDL